MTLPRRRPFSEGGAPPVLTDEVEKKLLEMTRMAVPMEVAASSVGIDYSTFRRYCAKGRKAEDKVLDAQGAFDGEDEDIVEPEDVLTDRELVYYQFWKRLETARAESVSRSVLSVQRGAAGGAVTEETIKSYRDPATGAVVEERTTKKAPPDWRAAAWMLERGVAGRQFFAKDAVQVELTGANGGALQVESVQADNLAEQIRRNLEAARAAITTTAAAITAGEPSDSLVEDAELVED